MLYFLPKQEVVRRKCMHKSKKPCYLLYREGKKNYSYEVTYSSLRKR